MWNFSKLIYWVQGVQKGWVPLLFMHSPACSLAHIPSLSPCMQPFPLHAFPLVLPPPLARGTSPYMQRFPLHVVLPLACSIAWAEGTRDVLSLLRPLACRGGRRAGQDGTGEGGGV